MCNVITLVASSMHLLNFEGFGEPSKTSNVRMEGKVYFCYFFVCFILFVFIILFVLFHFDYKYPPTAREISHFQYLSSYT